MTLKPPFPSSSACVGCTIPTSTSEPPSHTPQSPLPLEHNTVLPATYFTEAEGHIALTPEDDIVRFLKHDLDVSRLNYIHKKLWLAGRPMNYRSLCQQKMMKREIVITEQTDLHLTWSESTIFVKPFPRYLGNHEFWSTHLCQSEELYRIACGLLFSYTRLICYESDFNLARGLNLIPPILWTQWRTYVQDVRKTIDARPQSHIDSRYVYGELRLARLNLIYRFYGRPKDRSLIRGYFYEYRTYSSFFLHHFAWIFVVFAYMTVLLTAMQLGLATEHLQPSQRFQHAAYGFAVFSIAMPLIIVWAAATVFLFSFLYHLIGTLLSRHYYGKRLVSSKI